MSSLGNAVGQKTGSGESICVVPSPSASSLLERNTLGIRCFTIQKDIAKCTRMQIVLIYLVQEIKCTRMQVNFRGSLPRGQTRKQAEESRGGLYACYLEENDIILLVRNEEESKVLKKLF